MIYGIDVSENNGYVDWKGIRRKHDEIKFAIIRSSYGFSFDSRFIDNVYSAINNGFKCGAYHYSYALNKSEALIEAETMKKIINDSGMLLELPCFFDMEGDNYKIRNGFDFSKDNVTEICKTFIDEMKPLNTGVYANLNWLENNIDWKSLDCSVWSAQYNTVDDFKGYLWQYTDKLHLCGKDFDGDILYLDNF